MIAPHSELPNQISTACAAATRLRSGPRYFAIGRTTRFISSPLAARIRRKIAEPRRRKAPAQGLGQGDSIGIGAEILVHVECF
jgi:hypothetical protein